MHGPSAFRGGPGAGAGADLLSPRSIGLSALMAVALLVTAVVYDFRLQQALTLAEEQVVELNVTVGMQDLEEGDSLTALLWLTEALKQDKPSEARKHRTRIATALRQCPRLLQMLVLDHPMVGMRTNSTGGWVITSGGNDDVSRVWDVLAGHAGRRRTEQWRRGACCHQRRRPLALHRQRGWPGVRQGHHHGQTPFTAHAPGEACKRGGNPPGRPDSAGAAR